MVSSVDAAGGDPKDEGVTKSEQEIAQIDSVPSEGHDHREQRHDAHAGGDVQKSWAPCSEPEADEVEADDAPDGRVDLLLCAESRQQECRRIHAEELGGDCN